MPSDTFLITGASDGIGAVYADRLAARGHGLILVARRVDKLEALADRLRAAHGVVVDVLPADLGSPDGLALVEDRLRRDDAVTGLVNNAAIAGEGRLAQADPDFLSRLIALNVTAVTRLAAAAAARFAARGSGTVINVGSVAALMPDSFSAVYPATKAFVLALSEAMTAELGPKGVRVQAVLPGVVRTPIWTDEELARLRPEMIMEVDDMVDAALHGLDMGETVTIPSLPDMADYDAYIAARLAMRPNLSRQRPADRYSG